MARIGVSNPISHRPRLRRAMANIVQGDRPHQFVIFTTEHEQWNGRAAINIFL